LADKLLVPRMKGLYFVVGVKADSHKYVLKFSK
jgi:hypothetical protein